MAETRVKLTAEQGQIAADLSEFAIGRCNRVVSDVVGLCDDSRQHAHIGMMILAWAVGTAGGLLDRAEGNTAPPGAISERARALILEVLTGAATDSGRRVISEEGRDG